MNCPECGEKILIDTLYCMNCGSRIDDSILSELKDNDAFSVDNQNDEDDFQNTLNENMDTIDEYSCFDDDLSNESSEYLNSKFNYFLNEFRFSIIVFALSMAIIIIVPIIVNKHYDNNNSPKTTFRSISTITSDNIDEYRSDPDYSFMFEHLERQQNEMKFSEDRTEQIAKHNSRLNGDWITYEYLRTNATGKELTLNGKWRVLDDSDDSYYHFTDTEFYLYDSIDNLEDNYYKGTYSIYNGREGFQSAGMDSREFDYIMDGSNNRYSEENVYLIEFHPTTRIVNGQNISSVIKANEKWTYAWVLLNQDNGIKAEVYEDDFKLYTAKSYVKQED